MVKLESEEMAVMGGRTRLAMGPESKPRFEIAELISEDVRVARPCTKTVLE